MNDADKKTPFTPFKVALVQLNSSDNMDENISTITGFVREGAGMGADVVLLPENSSMMTFGRENILKNARNENNHPAIAALGDLARELKIWLHGGTFAIKVNDNASGAPLVNRTIVFSPDGKIAQRYDKIHMFDVDLSENESYRESETFRPGTKSALLDLPWGNMGLTTCYDVRFPHLYRRLANAGADFFAVPAAFTETTGKAHWHVLLRARAIENGCFVFAPAQCGTHPGNRKTFGHSLVVDPWGQVLGDGGEAPGVVMATIDMRAVALARSKVPSLRNEQPFE
ncbi:MAG: carbon-nitrogen hydrolase family protein [Rhodospirillaceae bacterium]|nr:carbon-nitrogen hydrolase family protein [Rhodospirillaceae bacterium]